MATTLIEVSGIDAFDSATLPASISLDVYIDNTSLDGVSLIHDAVADDCGCGAMKAHIALEVGFGSNGLSNRLKGVFGHLVGPH